MHRPERLSVALSIVLLSGLNTPVLAGEKSQSPPANLRRGISLEAVRLEETKLQNVLVVPWGRPSEKDARSIQEALARELAPYRPRDASAQSLKIWVVIRRYLLMTSNKEGSALASVAWCAARDADTIVFQEEFYAAKHKFGWSPKGAIKEAIVRRIAATARHLALAEADVEPSLPTVENTYLEFEEAKKHAGTVTASAPAGFVFADGYRVFGGVYVAPDRWAEHPDRIDWKEYLSRPPEPRP